MGNTRNTSLQPDHVKTDLLDASRRFKAMLNQQANQHSSLLLRAEQVIRNLEAQMGDTLSARDTVALSIYQLYLKDSMAEQAAERAYANADTFLRVRRGKS